MKYPVPTHDFCRPGRQRGLTLMELAVVLAVLAALAALTIPYVNGGARLAACQTTDATLAGLRDAIAGSAAGPGYRADLGDWPTSLQDLLTRPAGANAFNPHTGRGWRGPYVQGGGSSDAVLAHLSARFTTAGDYLAVAIAAGQPVILDHFSDPVCDAGDCRSPVVWQIPTGGTQCGTTTAVATPGDYVRLVSAGPDGVLESRLDDAWACARNDDRVLFVKMADPGANRPCSE